MKRGSLLALLIIGSSSCAMGPSRIDNIPDPRDSTEYKNFISHGGIADFSLDEQVHFKSGQPFVSSSINGSVTFGAPRFDFLNGFLVVAVHTKAFKIRVTGFTDATECQGQECESLSQRRADLVYTLLLKKGVPRERILKPISYGSTKPLTLNESDEDRARERRVEISLEDASSG